jgi:CRISPR-associated protein Cmr1
MVTPTIQLAYRLTFHSPAFLGNAEQAAQWRTPPIKALLRQWWRVVWAADQRGGVDVAAMRQAEGRLFGVAADGEGDSRKSQVRLRLDLWEVGTLKSWSGLDQERVAHPEVKNREGKVVPVGAHLYLGYGPLVFGQGTALKSGAAIDAEKSALLRLALPAGTEGERLKRALALMNLFGALGGRSRNGWGSFSLTPLEGTAPLRTSLDVELMLPWRDALKSDWAQAIGASDKGPLIWQTGAFDDWKKVMVQLARIKIALRTQQAFRFPHERPDGQVHDRHWLSYPVTKHKVDVWDKANLRLPNSLRFKVRPDADGKLRGVIFHMPCRPPPAFRPDPAAIERVWQQVHEHLDQQKPALERIDA